MHGLKVRFGKRPGVALLALSVAVTGATICPGTAGAATYGVSGIDNTLAHRCSASQLEVSWAGTNGAAGTVATGIQIRNLAKVSCELEGYPAATFFTPTSRRIKVSISHLGQGQLFAQSPARVLLGRGGFVFTSTDVNFGGVGCARIKTVRFSLPGVDRIYTVVLPYPQNACGPTSIVRISPLTVWNSVHAYVG